MYIRQYCKCTLVEGRNFQCRNSLSFLKGYSVSSTVAYPLKRDRPVSSVQRGDQPRNSTRSTTGSHVEKGSSKRPIVFFVRRLLSSDASNFVIFSCFYRIDAQPTVFVRPCTRYVRASRSARPAVSRRFHGTRATTRFARLSLEPRPPSEKIFSAHLAHLGEPQSRLPSPPYPAGKRSMPTIPKSSSSTRESWEIDSRET